MTVIAARVYEDRIDFAADSQTTAGRRKRTEKELHFGKLEQVNGMTIGSSGLKSTSQWLFHFARNHSPLSPTEVDVSYFFLEFVDVMRKRQADFKNENSFLLAFRDKLFHVYDGLSVFEVPEFSAIGSGQDFAIAAMHLDHNVATAAEIASALDVYCSGKIEVVAHLRSE